MGNITERFAQFVCVYLVPGFRLQQWAIDNIYSLLWSLLHVDVDIDEVSNVEP